MTTLDVFANNIIGNSNSVTKFSGENANRWIQIKAPAPSAAFANFFIVKKLSAIDSQSVSSTIDSTKPNLIFDNNGSIQAPTMVQNPLSTKPISLVEDDYKQFSNPNGDGYCVSRDIIFSSNLKWILYRDKKDTNQMYILYNPMHRKNVQDYYNSVSVKDPFGDDGGFMRTLIQKYRNTFTIIPLNTQTKTKAIFAEPTCDCYKKHDCNNDYAKFYINPDTSDKLDWSCACGGAKSCSYVKDNNPDSFLNQFQPNLIKNFKCPTQVSFCNMDFNAAGNINAKDSNIQQNCSVGQTTMNENQTEAPTQPAPTTKSPTTQPPSKSQTTQSPNTQPPSKSQTTQLPKAQSALSPLVIGGGISAFVIIISIIAFLIYKKNK